MRSRLTAKYPSSKPPWLPRSYARSELSVDHSLHYLADRERRMELVDEQFQSVPNTYAIIIEDTFHIFVILTVMSLSKSLHHFIILIRSMSDDKCKMKKNPVASEKLLCAVNVCATNYLLKHRLLKVCASYYSRKIRSVKGCASYYLLKICCVKGCASYYLLKVRSVKVCAKLLPT